MMRSEYVVHGSRTCRLDPPVALGTTVILVNSDPLVYAIFSDPGWHVIRMRMDDSAVHSSASDYPSFVEAKRALDSNQITWES